MGYNYSMQDYSQVNDKKENLSNFINHGSFFQMKEVAGEIEKSSKIFNAPGPYNFYRDLVNHRNPKKYNKKILEKVEISVNNFFHRSEDFSVLDTSKTNILFAGCSVTFGEALPESHSWPDYVLTKLRSEGWNLGPKQVLSFPGGSTDKIIRNIFRYVDQFGKPDYILLLLPDFFRKNLYNEIDSSYHIKMTYDFEKEEHFPEFSHLSFYDSFTEYKVYYEILSIFCRLNGIKLYGGSWYKFSSIAMQKTGDNTFIDINSGHALKYQDSEHFDKEYFYKLDEDFAAEAGDELHPGTISHMSIGHKFLERIKSDQKN